jgi:hypothetical protein
MYIFYCFIEIYFAKIKNHIVDSFIQKNELQAIKTNLQKSFRIFSGFHKKNSGFSGSASGNTGRGRKIKYEIKRYNYRRKSLLYYFLLYCGHFSIRSFFPFIHPVSYCGHFPQLVINKCGNLGFKSESYVYFKK